MWCIPSIVDSALCWCLRFYALACHIGCDKTCSIYFFSPQASEKRDGAHWLIGFVPEASCAVFELCRHMHGTSARSWHNPYIIKGLRLLICKMPKKHHQTNYGVEKVDETKSELQYLTGQERLLADCLKQHVPLQQRYPKHTTAFSCPKDGAIQNLGRPS